MFHDLDGALKAILLDAAVAPPLGTLDVSFKAPDKDFTFDSPAINLFLYGVLENRLCVIQSQSSTSSPEKGL